MKIITKLTELKNNWVYYRKKPIIIKATLLDEEVLIETLEGTMKGNKGDYVIEGINGEIYPCKPDIFHKTYTEEAIIKAIAKAVTDNKQKKKGKEEQDG